MKVNGWGEPSSQHVPERGDYVRADALGTVTGYVIGVTTCQGSYNCRIGHQERGVHRVSVVLDGNSQCTVETFSATELRIVKKGKMA
jgi:hypothetical protein